MEKADTGSCITPLRETNNENGLPGKNASPPRVRGKVTLFPLKSGLILSSFKNLTFNQCSALCLRRF